MSRKVYQVHKIDMEAENNGTTREYLTGSFKFLENLQYSHAVLKKIRFLSSFFPFSIRPTPTSTKSEEKTSDVITAIYGGLNGNNDKNLLRCLKVLNFTFENSQFLNGGNLFAITEPSTYDVNIPLVNEGVCSVGIHFNDHFVQTKNFNDKPKYFYLWSEIELD